MAGRERLRAALVDAARRLAAEAADSRAAAPPTGMAWAEPAEQRRAASTTTPTLPEVLRRQRYVDALLETIEVGIVACDADGNFVVTNRAERTLFGLDEGLDGRRMDYLGPRIDVFEAGRRLAPDEYPLLRALRGEDTSHVEVRAGPRGGPYRDLVVRGRQITEGDGRVLGAVAALYDVTAERAAARQLAEEHRRLAEAQRLGQLGSFEHDFVTGEWRFSDNLWALWGLEPGRATAASLAELIAAEDRPVVAAAWRDACADARTRRVDVQIRRANDGAVRHIRINFEVSQDDQGRPAYGRGTHLDITQLRAAEAAGRRANAFFHAILTATPDCTFVADVEQGTILYVSPGKELLGLDSADLVGLGTEGMVRLAHPKDRARVAQTIGAALALPDGEVAQVQYRAHGSGGTEVWLHQRVTPFRRDAGGRVVEVLAVVRDVTDVVVAQQRLAHAARHDHLTGLPNRAVLVERLEAALRRSRREGREVAVLFCDLDGFKRVNDLGGHAAGDTVLSEIAHRLVAVVRDGDVVARMGGDEFVIVVEPWNRAVASVSPDGEPSLSPPAGGDGAGRQLAGRIAQRVVEVLRAPVQAGGASYDVTGSVGIAYAGTGALPGAVELTADEILHHADLAMYRAKQQGKDHVEVYDLDDDPPPAGSPTDPPPDGAVGAVRSGPLSA